MGRGSLWAGGAGTWEVPLATVPLCHRPERRCLKWVLTSGRPGSKHRGVTMETTTQDPWGPGMGGVASARCGQG